MATNNSALQFRDALVGSGHQFAKDFLTMPQAMLAKSLKSGLSRPTISIRIIASNAPYGWLLTIIKGPSGS